MTEPTIQNGGQRRAISTIICISAIIIALSALSAWFLFFRGGNDADEREAYEQIIRYQQEGDFLMMKEAINEYFNTYNSDAFHYSMLKELSDRHFTEHDE